MTIKRFDDYLAPVLRVLADTGEPLKRKDLMERVAAISGVTPGDKLERVSSGEYLYKSRIGWAITYLRMATAVETVARGVYQISSHGRLVLSTYPQGMSHQELQSMSPAVDTAAKKETEPVTDTSSDDPETEIYNGIQRNNDEVAALLLGQLHASDPAFFEQSVLDLLIAMGYGGTQGKATRTQLSNDNGIDGIIDQDALGLSRIYVQAKRYDPATTITRPMIQGFVGALQGAQADRGVYITTASYSAGAVEYADAVNARVILIDGSRLTDLMLKYRVGVQVKDTISILEIDDDYFLT